MNKSCVTYKMVRSYSIDKQHKGLRTKEMCFILCLSCILVSQFGCIMCIYS